MAKLTKKTKEKIRLCAKYSKMADKLEAELREILGIDDDDADPTLQDQFIDALLFEHNPEPFIQFLEGE